MEFLYEFILELVFEGSIEVSKNRKIPKYIRYPIIFIISLFMLIIIGIIFLAGIIALQENLTFGIIIILFGIISVIEGVRKFKKTYLNMKNEQRKSE